MKSTRIDTTVDPTCRDISVPTAAKPFANARRHEPFRRKVSPCGQEEATVPYSQSMRRNSQYSPAQAPAIRAVEVMTPHMRR